MNRKLGPWRTWRLGERSFLLVRVPSLPFNIERIERIGRLENRKTLHRHVGAAFAASARNEIMELTPMAHERKVLL